MPPEIFIHGPLRFGCCASLLGSMAGCLQATSLRDHLRTALLASLKSKGAQRDLWAVGHAMADLEQAIRVGL
jgi:hypothetical protein